MKWGEQERKGRDRKAEREKGDDVKRRGEDDIIMMGRRRIFKIEMKDCFHLINKVKILLFFINQFILIH